MDFLKEKVRQMRMAIDGVGDPVDDFNDDKKHQQHGLPSDDHLSWLAFSSLLKIIQDPALIEFHMPATQCITFIVKELGPRARFILDRVLL